MERKDFIILIIGLAIILVVIAKVLDSLMAIFIIGIITCMVFTYLENERKKNDKL